MRMWRFVLTSVESFWAHTLLGAFIQLFISASVSLFTSFELLALLGPYCGGVCAVEVALTILKLTETDGKAEGQTNKHK